MMNSGMNHSGRHSGKARHQIVSEINITPLVDVMLVLLVIFMVTAPMMISGINVDLPETSSIPVSGQDEPLVVSIDKNGKIYIMETKIDQAHLIDKLKAITKAKMNSRIFVRGDKALSYGKIMTIVGEINAAGFSKVALITNVKQNEK